VIFDRALRSSSFQPVTHQTIVVLDFGSQFTQLIARRLRELSIYSEILPFDTSPAEIARRRPVGIILSGGPKSVSEPGAPRCERAVLESGVPVLGICYGMQLMTDLMGGEVAPAPHREFGLATIRIEAGAPLFATVPAELRVWASHGDFVAAAPPGFVVTATSANAPVAAMADPAQGLYALLFHPEVVHTDRGLDILRNFAYDVCGCTGDWTMASFVEEATARIREQVGDGRVVCGLSGGVDSTVAALLIHRAIGDRLTCIFVDNGVMRLDEAGQIRRRFERLQLPLVFVDAATLFLDRLAGVTDPERKRKIIGATFIDVFEAEAAKIGTFDFLAQGTLYPDVIESVSVIGPSHVIKSHHNVGGLPDRMRFKLVEPLRQLFKDEVRGVGKEMGLDDEFVWRQPFPGPGLAVRILGEVSASRLDLVRLADAIVVDEVKRAGWYRRLWQSFAVLLPVQSVGVMGDARTYEYTIAIRAVDSKDGMTADWARLPHELLAIISSRIVNEVKGINRVVFDISSKPPSTIEWE
jgi:GMP synthase (glutamine-hydrolysing)